jgi:hypothetical protein
MQRGTTVQASTNRFGVIGAMCGSIATNKTVRGDRDGQDRIASLPMLIRKIGNP